MADHDLYDAMPDSHSAFDRLELRRFKARVPIETLASAAGSNAETYYRWRGGVAPSADSLTRWNEALNSIIRTTVETLQALLDEGEPRPRDGKEMANGRTPQDHR